MIGVCIRRKTNSSLEVRRCVCSRYSIGSLHFHRSVYYISHCFHIGERAYLYYIALHSHTKKGILPSYPIFDIASDRYT